MRCCQQFGTTVLVTGAEISVMGGVLRWISGHHIPVFGEFHQIPENPEDGEDAEYSVSEKDRMMTATY